MSELFEFDQKIRLANNIGYIAGFDEAGRGPLAGPLCSAGVILPLDFDDEDINDSKRLTDKKRRILASKIKEVALAYYIVLKDVKTIDTLNVLKADQGAMEECLLKLQKKVNVEYIITDYVKLNTSIPLLSIPKADQTSLSVASASILAKVTRDDYMIKLDKKYPQYNFKKNKGYGTKEHLDAIKEYGYIKGIHRETFEPIKSMIEEENSIKLF